jgi:hypothetical protein
MEPVVLERNILLVSVAELSKEQTEAFREAFHVQQSQVELSHNPPARIRLGRPEMNSDYWRFPVIEGNEDLSGFVTERVIQAVRVALDHVRLSDG